MNHVFVAFTTPYGDGMRCVECGWIGGGSDRCWIGEMRQDTAAIFGIEAEVKRGS